MFFHKLGTPQDKDALVYERPDKPDWGFGAEVTEDGRFLLVTQTEGTDNRNRVFVRDLKKPGGRSSRSSTSSTPAYSVVGNDGDTFYVLTNKNAPRFRLVAITLAHAGGRRWKTLIPEAPGTAVLEGVTMVNNQFVTLWMTDAHHAVRIFGLDGKVGADVALPTLGSVAGLTGRRAHKEMFYSFGVVPLPDHDLPLRLRDRRERGVQEADAGVRPGDYETEQVFYPAKDGTRVPMFITYKKGLQRDGQNPTLLYGYGGFNISMMPAFSPAAAGWLEMGGRLRGGQPARRRRIRRGVARRRPAAEQAERLRRLHRRGRVADPREVHLDAEAGHPGRQQRRPAGRRVPDAAAGPVRRGAAGGRRDGHAALPQVHDRLGVAVRLRLSRTRTRPTSTRV